MTESKWNSGLNYPQKDRKIVFCAYLKHIDWLKEKRMYTGTFNGKYYQNDEPLDVPFNSNDCFIEPSLVSSWIYLEDLIEEIVEV